MKIKQILVGVTVLSGLLLGTMSASAQEIVQYVHTDALGSPVALSDTNGAIIERTVYEPYGAVVGGAKGDRPGFTGHVSDSATGLTYMQQRYYDPEIGTFLSSDPIAALGNPPEMFNRFWYAAGNPYFNLDPDGRAPRPGRKEMVTGSNIPGSGTARAAMATSAMSVKPTAIPAAGESASPSVQSSRWDWDDVLSRVGLKGDLTKNGNIFDVGALFHDIYYPFMDSPGGAGYKAAGAGLVAITLRTEGRIAFKTEHYAGRLEAAGLNVARTELVVGREVARIQPNLAAGANATGRMRINGVLVEYRLRALPNGGVNVGTIFPVK